MQPASPIDIGEMTWLQMENKQFRELYVSPVGQTNWLHCSNPIVRSHPVVKFAWECKDKTWQEKGRTSLDSIGMSTMQALLKAGYKVVPPFDRHTQKIAQQEVQEATEKAKTCG